MMSAFFTFNLHQTGCLTILYSYIDINQIRLDQIRGVGRRGVLPPFPRKIYSQKAQPERNYLYKEASQVSLIFFCCCCCFCFCERYFSENASKLSCRKNKKVWWLNIQGHLIKKLPLFDKSFMTLKFLHEAILSSKGKRLCQYLETTVKRCSEN